MDELTLLRELRRDRPEPSAATLDEARGRLEHRMAGATPGPRGASLRRRAALGAVAATVLAGGAGLLTTLGGSTAAGPPVAAGPTRATAPGTARDVSPAPAMTPAALLRRAAANTLRTGDPVVGPGQYTYVRTHAWFQNGVAGPGVTYQSEQEYETWIPAAADGTWYWRYTRPIAMKFYRPGDKAEVAAAGLLPHRHVELYVGRDGEITREKGPGDPNERTATVGPPGWGNPTPAWLATLPRNPGQLLALLRKAIPTGEKGGVPLEASSYVFSRIADVLSTGLVPADLRAALYQVASRLPGITLVDSTANLDGRHGVAIGHASPNTLTRRDIIFDSAGGQFIGERDVLLRSETVDQPDVNGPSVTLPAGTVIGSTAVTIGVADQPGF